jgi:hypothetical protein
MPFGAFYIDQVYYFKHYKLRNTSMMWRGILGLENNELGTGPRILQKVSSSPAEVDRTRWLKLK